MRGQASAMAFTTPILWQQFYSVAANSGCKLETAYPHCGLCNAEKNGSADANKPLTREAEPDTAWVTPSERKGANPIQV